MKAPNAGGVTRGQGRPLDSEVCVGCTEYKGYLRVIYVIFRPGLFRIYLNIEYPWVRLDRPDEELRPKGLVITYAVPPLSST